MPMRAGQSSTPTALRRDLVSLFGAAVWLLGVRSVRSFDVVVRNLPLGFPERVHVSWNHAHDPVDCAASFQFANFGASLLCLSRGLPHPSLSLRHAEFSTTMRAVVGQGLPRCRQACFYILGDRTDAD